MVGRLPLTNSTVLRVVERGRCSMENPPQPSCREGWRRLQELQDVLPILGRPLVRWDVWGLLRMYDGHEAGLFSSLPLLLRAWAQWLIT